jgi:thymidylate synthase
MDTSKSFEHNYLALMRRALHEGTSLPDRTGSGRRKVFGPQIEMNIADGTIPVVTTRKIYLTKMVEETLWFISGNKKHLPDGRRSPSLWDQWAVSEEQVYDFFDKHYGEQIRSDEEFKKMIAQHIASAVEQVKGEIGPLYGAMWRDAPMEQHPTKNLWPRVPVAELPSDKLADYKQEYNETWPDDAHREGLPADHFEQFCSDKYYESFDQLNELVRNLKARPFSSRHVVNAWIPTYVPFETLTPQENVMLGKGALTACHVMFQCLVLPAKEMGGKMRLSMKMTIRSADLPIGTPYNVAQYCMLLAMLAQVTGMVPDDFIISYGDAHLYLNQLDLVEKQIEREPLAPPKLWLNPEITDLFAFTAADIKILDYNIHPDDEKDPIKYPVSM